MGSDKAISDGSWMKRDNTHVHKANSRPNDKPQDSAE